MDVTTNLSSNVYRYLINHSIREPFALSELRSETHKLPDSIMQISPEQGQFMALLVQLMGAKKTLDIGTFTGYSALAVALALPTDGKVIAFDVSEEWTNIAKTYWNKANVADKIDLKLGSATDSLDALLANGEANTYDFAFIDADKANYDNYYERALKLVRPGGLIAVDNVLWSGRVADPDEHDASTTCIRNLNSKIFRDERVSISMLPIGDGLTLTRKRS